MRFFVMPKLTMVFLFLFLFSSAGCSSSKESGKDNPGGGTIKAFQTSLGDFNLALENAVFDMEMLIMTIENLNEVLETGNDMQVDLFQDQFRRDIDFLIESIEDADWAETDIQAAMGNEKIKKALGLTLLGAGIVMGGMYAFGKFCSGKSDELSAARKRRDDAAGRGDIDAYNTARRDMGKIGEDVIQELGTKVTTDLILSPINPTSATGLILKEAAGNAFQEGLKVISATDKCKSGYDAPGCVIGISETDDSGTAAIAGSSRSTVVVGGADVSRIVISDVNAPPGASKEVTRAKIPVNGATPDIIAANDAGTYDPDDKDPGETAPAMTLSYQVSSQDEASITYNVAAAIGGIKKKTTVTLEVQNAMTSGASKTLDQDGTIIWSVTVLENNGVVSVHRSDTGERQTITLPGKGPSLDYDGTYTGRRYVLSSTGNCSCPIASDLTVYVSGSAITGDFSGTITPAPWGQDDTFEGVAADGTVYTGKIGMIYPGPTVLMTGSYEGCCSGVFDLTR